MFVCVSNAFGYTNRMLCITHSDPETYTGHYTNHSTHLPAAALFEYDLVRSLLAPSVGLCVCGTCWLNLLMNCTLWTAHNGTHYCAFTWSLCDMPPSEICNCCAHTNTQMCVYFGLFRNQPTTTVSQSVGPRENWQVLFVAFLSHTSMRWAPLKCIHTNLHISKQHTYKLKYGNAHHSIFFLIFHDPGEIVSTLECSIARLYSIEVVTATHTQLDTDIYCTDSAQSVGPMIDMRISKWYCSAHKLWATQDDSCQILSWICAVSH